MKKITNIAVFIAIVFIFISIFSNNDENENEQSAANKHDLVILSGSENQSLEPLLEKFSKDEGISIKMEYKGSVDIMRELQNGAEKYDAIWPANSLWIGLGDKHNLVKHSQSIMISPVVFGIKKSLAKKFGFDSKEVYVKDILEKIESKELKFTMTSATQSNSGATSYIGFLYALLGNPETITKEDLHSEALKKSIKKLLAGVNRSSGSSGWLKELFVKSDYDAMVNYEAMLIEANQELIAKGKEPLYAIYPRDGLAMADSPLGYINHGDTKKEEQFKKLQSYLLSKETQKAILAQGRRTGFGGSNAQDANPKVFNPDWGIDVNKVLNYIKMPDSDLIFEALNLYQGDFRKPSFTILALDFSGSMEGAGEDGLRNAMNLLLDVERAKEYFLQPSTEDKLIVLPFNHELIALLSGNISDYPQILEQINALHASGGTNIYLPIIEGLKIAASEPNLEKYVPAIILMTDGKSEIDSRETFQKLYTTMGLDIPIFSILFANADKSQLEEIAQISRARIFDGKKDLIKAFRQAKGYN